MAAARHDPASSLRFVAASAVFSASSIIAMHPATYWWIGEIFGFPDAGMLLMYLCSYLFAVLLHLLMHSWDASTAENARIIAAYTVTGVALIGLFFLVQPALLNHASMTPSVTADNLAVVAFPVAAWAAIAVPLLAAAAQCRRVVAPGASMSADVRRGVNAIRWGCLLLGYADLLSAGLLCFRKMVSPTWVGAGLVLQLGAAAGVSLVHYGYLSPAWRAWQRERRDFRRLRPLWELVVRQAELSSALNPPGPLTERFALNVRKWHLPRRVMEISDSLHALQPWMAPRESEQAASDPGVVARRTAVMVMDALARKECGGRPPRMLSGNPSAGVGADQERLHLVMVAEELRKLTGK